MSEKPAQSSDKPYGEVLDEMDHQAKYQSATLDTRREQQLRIQALGAALSRRDWHATERAYEVIRDEFDKRGQPLYAAPPAATSEPVGLSPAQTAYALLWREMRVSDKPYVREARKTLLASLTHAQQRDAIAWVQSKYPVTEHEILENAP